MNLMRALQSIYNKVRAFGDENVIVKVSAGTAVYVCNSFSEALELTDKSNLKNLQVLNMYTYVEIDKDYISWLHADIDLVNMKYTDKTLYAMFMERHLGNRNTVQDIYNMFNGGVYVVLERQATGFSCPVYLCNLKERAKQLNFNPETTYLKGAYVDTVYQMAYLKLLV